MFAFTLLVQKRVSEAQKRVDNARLFDSERYKHEEIVHAPCCHVNLMPRAAGSSVPALMTCTKASI
jgi:hypothetical protein